jgi:tRNA A37 methylthiotransferase MiaB
MKKNTFYLASLGCAKNTVDSDSMAVLLEEDGYQAVEKPNNAEVLIVNTCGFIQSARQESIEVLRELAEKKKTGQILVAAGCLTERSRELMVNPAAGWISLISSSISKTLPQARLSIISLSRQLSAGMKREWCVPPCRAQAPISRLQMAAADPVPFVPSH